MNEPPVIATAGWAAGELHATYATFQLAITGRMPAESAGSDCGGGHDALFHIAADVPRRVHQASARPAIAYAVHYRPDLLSAELYRELLRVGRVPLTVRGTRVEPGRQFRAIIQEMLFEQECRRFGWEALLVSRLTDLAIMTVRLSRGDEIAIDRTRESTARVASYVARLQNRCCSAASLDEAARCVGLGRRRFTELFRAVTGESWHRYVHRLRMAEAAKLLASTEHSITAIAFECGFEELSHFHRSFKVAFDMTPLAYRTKFRGGQRLRVAAVPAVA